MKFEEEIDSDEREKSTERRKSREDLTINGGEDSRRV